MCHFIFLAIKELVARVRAMSRLAAANRGLSRLPGATRGETQSRARLFIGSALYCLKRELEVN